MMNADAQLGEVLQANGDGNLYEQVVELGHPPVVFGWQNVERFIQAIESARARADAPGAEPLPPDPLELPAVVTAPRLKKAVLAYMKPQKATGLLSTSCLLCSLPESVTVGYKLRVLEDEPWTQRVVAGGEPHMLPLASVYMPRGLRSSALDRVIPERLAGLWG
jgi:hypothetical protein